MKKLTGFGRSLQDLTTSTAGATPNVSISMISISAGLADDPLIDRGAADSNSGR